MKRLDGQGALAAGDAHGIGEAIAHALVHPDWRERAIDRRFFLASARAAEVAVRLAADRATPIDLVVTSPTPLSRRSAAAALGGRWVFTSEEPLLAPRSPAESGDDVLARLARTLRGVRAYEANAPLVICDTLDVLGASVYALDEEGLIRAADGLDALLPLP